MQCHDFYRSTHYNSFLLSIASSNPSIISSAGTVIFCPPTSFSNIPPEVMCVSELTPGPSGASSVAAARSAGSGGEMGSPYRGERSVTGGSMGAVEGDRMGSGKVSGADDGPALIVGTDGKAGEFFPNTGSGGIVGEVVGGRSSPSSSPVRLQELPGVDGSSPSSRFGTTIAGAPSARQIDAGSPELNSRSNSDAQSCGVSGSCRMDGTAGTKLSSPKGFSALTSGDRAGEAELNVPQASSCSE